MTEILEIRKADAQIMSEIIETAFNCDICDFTLDCPVDKGGECFWDETRQPITFVNVFLMTDSPWICLNRGESVRSYRLTKPSLVRLVDALRELPGRFNIDHLGWTWSDKED